MIEFIALEDIICVFILSIINFFIFIKSIDGDPFFKAIFLAILFGIVEYIAVYVVMYFL